MLLASFISYHITNPGLGGAPCIRAFWSDYCPFTARHRLCCWYRTFLGLLSHFSLITKRTNSAPLLAGSWRPKGPRRSRTSRPTFIIIIIIVTSLPTASSYTRSGLRSIPLILHPRLLEAGFSRGDSCILLLCCYLLVSKISNCINTSLLQDVCSRRLGRSISLLLGSFR